MIDKNDIKLALRSLDERMTSADNQLEEWVRYNNEFTEPDWLIESCFLQLIAIAESMNLTGFQQMLLKEYSKVKLVKDGFIDYKTNPNDDPYSTVLGRVRCFKLAIDGFFPEEPIISVTKDVLQILRDIHYSIADPKVFGSSPANENDVHLRIEGILKCVFPDLKHKPALTKQIKNFEPDTGIPSVRTLIEYKFISRSEDAGRIADEILADTRGYTSPEWSQFIYVIYETNRFKKEAEWNQLLRESGVPNDTNVIVLSGEPHRTSLRKKANTGIPQNSSRRKTTIVRTSPTIPAPFATPDAASSVAKPKRE